MIRPGIVFGEYFSELNTCLKMYYDIAETQQLVFEEIHPQWVKECDRDIHKLYGQAFSAFIC